MNAAKYRMEFDSNKLPSLVKDSEYTTSQMEINTQVKLYEVLRETVHIDKLCEQHVYLVCPSSALTPPVCIFEISHGTVNASLISPREIIQRVLMCGGKTFFIIHNHPSSDCNPSEDDVKACKRLKTSAEIMGLFLADFMITGDLVYYSFLEEGIL